MDVLVQLARDHDLIVIEDAAQGYRATYKGRPLGTKVDVACFSFHETKNVMCGEGGALLINRPGWVERAEVIQEKGTNRSKFFRGQVDKYTWTDIGSSYVLSDISAAFLWAQLEQATEITASRIALWETYHTALEELEIAGRIRRPVVPSDCVHNAHMYYILLPNGVDRDTFIQRLAAEGVSAVFHYVPLHSSPAGLRYGRAHGSLDVTDSVSESLVRLPLWVGLSTAEVERVVESVTRVLDAS
jgi:dTDP-4-amino-4,6-dideoxygalactose transaminase